MLEVKLTNENFEEEVLKNQSVVLVDFWATWCGPCKMIAPVLEEIAKEFEGRVKVGKVNVDEEGELAVKYRVSSIPTLVLFKNGNIVNVTVGFHSKAEIENMINKAL